VISYGLSLGGYRVYIHYSIVQLWTPESIVHCLFCKYLQRHSAENIVHNLHWILCLRETESSCSIQQAWLSVVGSTAGGVGFLRTPVLSWKVGGGSAGGPSPTCECYRLIISESVYWITCKDASRNCVTKIVLHTVWFYCGWPYLYVGVVPAASDSMEVWVGEEPWGFSADMSVEAAAPLAASSSSSFICHHRRQQQSHLWTIRDVKDIRLSQLCCWGFRCSGVWRRVAGLVFTDVFKCWGVQQELFFIWS
jgi:hypothetical protein